MVSMRWKREKNARKRIAERHIETLITMAVDTAPAHPGRSRRYIAMAREISKRHKVAMGRERKRLFCKECSMPLIPSVTSRVRTTGGKVTTTCLSCGAVSRYPYVREKRKLCGHGCHKAPGGLICADVSIRKSMIVSLRFTGDFFFYPEDALDALENAVLGSFVDDARSRIVGFFDSEQIQAPGAEPDDFVKALFAALENKKG